MICEICECDPCDCEDLMGFNNELWGVGKKRNERDGEISPLVDERDWSQRINGKQMEEGNQTQDRILSESLCDHFQGEEDPTDDYDFNGS